MTSTDKKNDTLNSEAILQSFAKGEDLALLRGLDPKAIDFIYAAAGFHYASGNPALAARMLEFACLHKHQDAQLWLAFARAASAAGKARMARKAWLVSYALNPTPQLCVELARAYLAADAAMQSRQFLAAARTLANSTDEAPELNHDITMLERHLAAMHG